MMEDRSLSSIAFPKLTEGAPVHRLIVLIAISNWGLPSSSLAVLFSNVIEAHPVAISGR